MNPVTILETDLFQREIKQVALLHARELTKDGILKKREAEQFYITSGLKVIFRHLINNGIIRDRADSIFIEFSTLVSTLGDDHVLDAFTLVHSRETTVKENGINTREISDPFFKENVEKRFKPIIKSLRDNHLAIFNHPEFLIEAQTMNAYISCFDKESPYITKEADPSSDHQLSLDNAKIFFEELKSEIGFDDKHQELMLTEYLDPIKETSVFVNSSAIKDDEITYKNIIKTELLDKYRAKCDNLLTLHFLNHLLYQKYFVDPSTEFSKSIFISLPIVASSAELKEDIKSKISDVEHITEIEGQPYKGLGALFIFITLRSKDEEYNKVMLKTLPFFIENIQDYCKSILYPVKDFIHGYAFETSEKLRGQIEKMAVKSAIAAVMSRNMSHNIGSHVMPESITYFQNKIANVIKSSVIAEKAKLFSSSEDADEIGEKIKSAESELTYYEEAIQKYNFYLQERMELIAEVSSSTDMSVCYEYNLKELIDEFDNNIIIKHGLIDSLNSDESIVQLTQKNTNVTVSLPGGQIGVQAFYLILENKIRNCFKHAQPVFDAGQYVYPITISISEYEDQEFRDNFFVIDVFDTLGEANPDRDQSIINNINEKIDGKILQDNKTLRQEGWGLLEMKIAAAYLINFPLKELDTPSEHNAKVFDKYPKIIHSQMYSGEGDLKEEEKNIGYRFSLLKPKFCLISSELLGSDANLEMLKKHGIEPVSHANMDLNSPYQFIICKDVVKLRSNQRVIFADKNNFDFSNLYTLKIDLFKKDVWQWWINQTFKNIKDLEIIHKTEEIFPGHKYTDMAIFDSHGRQIEIDGHNYEQAKLNDIKNKFNYYEPYSSRSGIVSLLNQKQSFKNEIIESIGTSVCIIDERLQDAADKFDSNQKNLKISEILSLSGIILPPKDGVFDLKRLFIEGKNCKEIIETYILQQFEFSKYIIIHFTIFEKLVGSNKPNDIQEYLHNFIKDNKLEEQEKILILMSGRGTPSNLPKDCYYIHLSTIQNAVLLKRSKFSLVKVLYSIRKSK